MNRGAHGDSSLMLSTLVLSNENRQLADRREEAPPLQVGEDVTQIGEIQNDDFQSYDYG